MGKKKWVGGGQRVHMGDLTFLNVWMSCKVEALFYYFSLLSSSLIVPLSLGRRATQSRAAYVSWRGQLSLKSDPCYKINTA